MYVCMCVCMYEFICTHIYKSCHNLSFRGELRFSSLKEHLTDGHLPSRGGGS